MSLLISKVFTYDVDAGNYIQAVEAADAQALEPATRQAINNFVLGCKADGIWSAIKASCILAGARTLAGALVPLVGAAPTNVGFIGIGTDYVRKTGLKGNGTTKYLNSNRAANAQAQNNQSLAVYGSDLDTNVNVYIGSSSAGVKNGGLFSTAPSNFYINNQISIGGNQPITTFGTMQPSGFAGSSRSSSVLTTGRRNGINAIASDGSSAPSSDSYYVFCTNSAGVANNFSAARLAFYSIGESLDLALLDARVTALINAFAAAIP
jgi:hypothetical protein